MSTLATYLATLALALRPGPFGADMGPEPGQVRPLPAGELPRELEGVYIDDVRGVELPRDLAFTNQDGTSVTLADYLVDRKPLLLVFAYYQCPSLCSVVLNDLTKGMQSLSWTAGKEYRALVVSFDPRDDVAAAAAKRETYVAQYGREVASRGWDFLVGPEANEKALAAALGFHYRWDPGVKQYAHAAGIYVVTPEGKVSRVLMGLGAGTNPRDLRLSLVEASEGKLGGVGDKILLFCYRWDRRANGFVLASLKLMKLGGAITVLILGTWLFRHWRKERTA